MSESKPDVSTKPGEYNGQISSDESQSSISKSSKEEFNPGLTFKLAFTSLCVVTLMAALDATSISVALPVSLPHHMI